MTTSDPLTNPSWADLTDGGQVDGQDPGELLVPGSVGDVVHAPPIIVPGDSDYVPPAADVDEIDDDEEPDAELTAGLIEAIQAGQTPDPRTAS